MARPKSTTNELTNDSEFGSSTRPILKKNVSEGRNLYQAGIPLPEELLDKKEEFKERGII